MPGGRKETVMSKIMSGIIIFLVAIGPLDLIVTAFMLMSLKSVRLHVSKDKSRISAADGLAMTALYVPAILIVVVTFVFLGLSRWSLLVTTFMVLVLAGSRVDIEIAGGRVLVARKLFFAVAWHRRALFEASAWVDGWGDWLDPEGLYIGDEVYCYELGWSGANSGELACKLAYRINSVLAGARKRERRGQKNLGN